MENNNMKNTKYCSISSSETRTIQYILLVMKQYYI